MFPPVSLSLAGATLAFFLCNLAFWMDSQTTAGKFAAALWWFTAALFLFSYKVKPELLMTVPFALTWGLDIWIRKRTPAWAKRLRRGVSKTNGN